MKQSTLAHKCCHLVRRGVSSRRCCGWFVGCVVIIHFTQAGWTSAVSWIFFFFKCSTLTLSLHFSGSLYASVVCSLHYSWYGRDGWQAMLTYSLHLQQDLAPMVFNQWERKKTFDRFPTNTSRHWGPNLSRWLDWSKCYPLSNPTYDLKDIACWIM